MGQTGLPFDPFDVDSVVATDQDPLPVVDEFFKSLFGTIGMDHEKGHQMIGHDPQPDQLTTFEPVGFIHPVDLCLSGNGTDLMIMRFKGVRSYL